MSERSVVEPTELFARIAEELPGELLEHVYVVGAEQARN